MATEVANVRLIISAVDNASSVIDGIGGKSRGLGRDLATVGKVVAGGLAAASTAAIAFGVSSVKSFAQAQVAGQKLTTIIMNHTGETLANVEALNKQADALEQVGVVSNDNITAAQAQLATFDLSSKAIAELTPALLDMTVAERGVNLTQQDLRDSAQTLGAALMGQVRGLKQQGFYITENQQKLLEHGDEMTRVTTIAEILGNTYDGVNAKMKETAEGKIVALNNAFDSMKQKIGEVIYDALNPAIDSLLGQFDQLKVDWDTKVQPPLNTLNQSLKDLGGNLFIAGGNAYGLDQNLSPLTKTVLLAIGFMQRLVDAVDSLAIAWNFAVDKLSDFFYFLIRVDDKIKSVAKSIGDTLSKIPGGGVAKGIMNFLTPGKMFQTGGVVPGRPGEAVPIIAHGGEVITNPNLGQNYNNTNNFQMQVSLDSDSAVYAFFQKMAEKERAAKFGVANA